MSSSSITAQARLITVIDVSVRKGCLHAGMKWMELMLCEQRLRRDCEIEARWPKHLGSVRWSSFSMREGEVCVQGQLCNRSMVYPAVSLQHRCMANMEMPLLTATEQAVPTLSLTPPHLHCPPAPTVCLSRGLSNVITAGDMTPWRSVPPTHRHSPLHRFPITEATADTKVCRRLLHSSMCVSIHASVCVCVRVYAKWTAMMQQPCKSQRNGAKAKDHRRLFWFSHKDKVSNIHTKPTKRSHNSQIWLIQVWTMRSDMQANHSVVPMTQMESSFLILSPVCLRTSLVPVLSDSCWLLLSTPSMLVCEAKIELLSLFVQGRSHRREDEQQAGKHGGDVRWRRL